MRIKTLSHLFFSFLPGIDLVLTNISENGFSFLPASATGLTRVSSATACELQVSLLQSQSWLQLELVYLRLGQEQKCITVATIAFLYSYITVFHGIFGCWKHNRTFSGPKGLGSHLYSWNKDTKDQIHQCFSVFNYSIYWCPLTKDCEPKEKKKPT